MKRPYIKALGLIVVVLAIGLVFTSLKSSKKYKFKESAMQLHTELLASKHQIDPNTALDVINNKDDNYVFVDLRNPREYANFHIQGAINVPMQRVLDDAYIPYLKDNRIKVLYSENSIDANQVRLLLTQYGYDNLMVLQGGANYWKENMVSKDVFKSKGMYDDEQLNFDPEKLKGED
jgi:rhodanese-related sulfurtransferase